jgi:CRISPR system Cascade subunit CasE
MAFPSRERRKKENDPDFLKPYVPDDFPETRHIADQNAEETGPETLSLVHSPRDSNSGFLFRVDALPGASVAIVVLSAIEPDWDYAFGLKPGLVDPRTNRPIGNAGCLLAAPPETKDYSPTFSASQEFRFRIRVNLSRKSHEHRKERADKLDVFSRPKSQGKRVALTWDKDEGPDAAVRDWFASKTTGCGFSLCDFRMLHLGWVVGYRPKARTPREESKDEDSGRKMRWRSALLEGTLVVTDTPAFSEAVASGIGPAKAFGFGLLSIAPVRV